MRYTVFSIFRINKSYLIDFEYKFSMLVTLSLGRASKSVLLVMQLSYIAP